MTENRYTLTLNLDFDTLQYMTKFHELFTNTYAYANGLETLENIMDQLDKLRDFGTVPTEQIDLDDVGDGPEPGQKPWEH